MLKLTSQGLKDLAAVSGDMEARKRSTGTIAVSTAIGAGMVWAGVSQAHRHRNNWWHLLTALGAVNLVKNGVDIVDRGTK